MVKRKKNWPLCEAGKQMVRRHGGDGQAGRGAWGLRHDARRRRGGGRCDGGCVRWRWSRGRREAADTKSEYNRYCHHGHDSTWKQNKVHHIPGAGDASAGRRFLGVAAIPCSLARVRLQLRLRVWALLRLHPQYKIYIKTFSPLLLSAWENFKVNLIYLYLLCSLENIDLCCNTRLSPCPRYLPSKNFTITYYIIKIKIKIKSVALQLQRAKTDWSGCCHMAVQGALWLAKRLSLNLNFRFLNRIFCLVTRLAPNKIWCVPGASRFPLL